MNLIVYATRPGEAEAATRTVDELATRHPSRAIVVLPEEGHRFSLDADVTLHRHPLASRGLVVERVLLHAKGADPAGLDTLVIPLLIPHLQSVLWWMGDPDLSDPAMRSLLAICDRLVVDSSLGAPGRLAGLSLQVMGTNQTPISGVLGRLVIGDLNWSRLDAFRETLARIFDETHRLTYLDGLTRLEVIGVRRRRDPPTAAELLIAGWLASRLGCSAPEPGPTGLTVLTGGSKAHRAALVFSGEPRHRGARSSAPLHGFRLEAVRGSRRLEVEMLVRGDEGHLRVEETGLGTSHRTVPLPVLPESEVLRRELARGGRDRVYEDSLLLAARIQGGMR